MLIVSDTSLRATHKCHGSPPDFVIIAVGSFNGLAYDWIADNLYVATDSAVLACNNDKPFRCATLLRHRGPTYGIALDPNEG